MKGTSLFLCLALAVIMALVPATAYSGVSAPVVDLPETGQTTSYYAGDDGDLQMGVDWPTIGNSPNGRFNDNSDGTITDLLTGLVWLKDANCSATSGYDADGIMTWPEALNFADGINTGSINISACSSYSASYTDWRVPNIIELESLISYGLDSAVPSDWLITQLFTNVQYGHYWTTNEYGGTSETVWVINFLDIPNNVMFGSAPWRPWHGPLRDYPGIPRPYQNEGPLNFISKVSTDTDAGDGFVTGPYTMLVSSDSGTPAGEVELLQTGETRCYCKDDGPGGNCPDTACRSLRCSIDGNYCSSDANCNGGATPSPPDLCNDFTESWCRDTACTSPATLPGQDGELQKGYDPSWPSPINNRFTNNGDGTITDQLTGLMWLRDFNCIRSYDQANPGSAFDNDAYGKRCQYSYNTVCTVDADCPGGETCTRIIGKRCSVTDGTACEVDADCPGGETCVNDGVVTWPHALDFIAGVNNGTYDISVCNGYAGNYTDWRMPNITELRSLSLIYSSSWTLVSAGFRNIVGYSSDGFYAAGQWSATTYPHDTTQALGVVFNGAAISVTVLNFKDLIQTDRITTGPDTLPYIPGWTKGKSGQPGKVALVRSVDGDDGDGIPVEVEDNAPNSGDGNDDGLPDLVQRNVTSLPSATGAGYVTVVTSGGGCTQNLNVQTAVAAPADPPFSYPFGVVGFEVRCTGPADMEIIYHGSSDLTGMVYRNYGSMAPAFGAPEWYELTGVTFGTRVIGGQTVATATFTINDDQLGDHNDVGGTIVSLGGPGLPAPAMAIPTMTQWGMIVFMLLAISGAVYYLRRRRIV